MDTQVKREFAIYLGKKKDEIEISEGDLVQIYAVNLPNIHNHIILFQGFSDNQYVKFKYFGGETDLFPVNMISQMEIIARNNTRQCEILMDIILQNLNLKKKIEKIQKNAKEIFCMD